MLVYFLHDLERQNKAIAKEEKRLKAKEAALAGGNPVTGDDDEAEDEEEDDDGDNDGEGGDDAEIEDDDEDEDDEDDEDDGEEEEEEEEEEDLGSDEDIGDGITSGRPETLEDLAAQAHEYSTDFNDFLELEDETFDTPINAVDEISYFAETAKAATEQFRDAFSALSKKQQTLVQRWVTQHKAPAAAPPPSQQ
jgi:hypothetical protein